MFKRFLVMDLFYGSEDMNIGDWKAVADELPSNSTGMYRVRAADASEFDAYYCEDKMYHLATFYGARPSHWWHRQTKESCSNVTHWKDHRLQNKN